MRLIAVDLQSMLAQEFVVDDSGRRLQHGGAPMPCRDAAKMAVWRASSVTAAPVTAARAVWSPTIPATSDPARSRNSRVRIRGGY